jgi:hypothetical protein
MERKRKESVGAEAYKSREQPTSYTPVTKRACVFCLPS